jgi:hypothetical protein
MIVARVCVWSSGDKDNVQAFGDNKVLGHVSCLAARSGSKEPVSDLATDHNMLGKRICEGPKGFKEINTDLPLSRLSRMLYGGHGKAKAGQQVFCVASIQPQLVYLLLRLLSFALPSADVKSSTGVTRVGQQ